MKRIFKLALITALTLFVYSCGDDDAVTPRAAFTYEVEGLTVTFTNKSKDATSYLWDFGDNTTSTEKDPVHTYSQGGDYTVTLTATHGKESKTYSEEITLVKGLITIDGNFSDWNEVPANKLAVATLPDGASLAALKEMKLCADDNFIYFYAKFDKRHVGPFDMCINSDNKDNTGGILWLWDPCGVDVLIETWSVDEFAEAAEVFLWPPDAAQDGWEWQEFLQAGSGIVSTSDVITISGDIVAIEGSIIREMLPGTLANEIGVGIFVSNTDWAETGVLPRTAADESAPLLKVKLN